MMKPVKRSNDEGQDPPQARTLKRSKLDRACERCRVKKRKCTPETPCLHCIKDGTICSKQKRRRLRRHTVPSEKSIEFYEYQLHQLSAAVSELYKQLYQTGQIGIQADGSQWPENPNVHGIIELLNLPDDDRESTTNDSAGSDDEDIDGLPSKRVENIAMPSAPKHQRPSTDRSMPNHHDSVSPSSLHSAQSTPTSETTDVFSTIEDETTAPWYSLSNDAVWASEPFDQFSMESGIQLAEAPLYDTSLLIASEDWSRQYDRMTNPVSLTVPYF